MLMLLAIWVSYVLGAILGAFATVRWGPAGLSGAVAGLLVAAAWDLCFPWPVKQEAP